MNLLHHHKVVVTVEILTSRIIPSLLKESLTPVAEVMIPVEAMTSQVILLLREIIRQEDQAGHQIPGEAALRHPHPVVVAVHVAGVDYNLSR